MTKVVRFPQHLRHAVVSHVLDAGRIQLVEHLGMLRPHSMVGSSPAARTSARSQTCACAQEADEKRGVAATRRQGRVSQRHYVREQINRRVRATIYRCSQGRCEHKTWTYIDTTFELRRIVHTFLSNHSALNITLCLQVQTL